MSKGIRHITLHDDAFGDVPVCVVSAEAVLSLQDTKWFPYIKGVQSENMSHALHGFLTPLMQEIGPEARHVLKKMNRDHLLLCHEHSTCMIATKDCIPGAKTPLCYLPPDETESMLVADIVQAWKRGCYVVYVIGEEISLW